MSHITNPAPEFTPSGQLRLGVFFQGVNSGTVWKTPEAGSQTDFESFRQAHPDRGARDILRLFPR